MPKVTQFNIPADNYERAIAFYREVGLPGVAWFAVCQDSEGNTFAVFQPDRKAS